MLPRRAHFVWPALALGLVWGLLRLTGSGDEVGSPLEEAAPAAVSRPAPAFATVVSPAAAHADLAAVLAALAPRWRALAVAPDAAFLRDSVAQLQPWLVRQPEPLWPALAGFGPQAWTLGVALVMAVLPTDPAAALRHAAELARVLPAQAETIYASLLEPWAQRREHALLLEALALAPLREDARERLRQEAAARWAETDPARAAAWVQQTGGAAPLLPAIHDRWINHDARSATAFASSLPGPQREALLREAVSRWLALDGAAAREWLRSQGPQGGLDATLALHASSDELLRHQPDEALAVAQRISDPALRWQTLVTMARHLDDIDPALTDQWPNRLPLMPGERARLLAEARAPLPVQQDE